MCHLSACALLPSGAGIPARRLQAREFREFRESVGPTEAISHARWEGAAARLTQKGPVSLGQLQCQSRSYIVGPVHTLLDLRSCHHTQPQLLKLGIKEIKQRHKMKSSSRSPQKLSAQGCPSNAPWWNSADKSKEEVLHQLQEAQPPLLYPAGARWGQWLLSWLLEAHNPEGLGSPKVKSMGLCFPRAHLLPHFPRRCS